MKELRLPLPEIELGGNLSIKVNTVGKDEIEYKLEQFCWNNEDEVNNSETKETEESLSEIYRLKNRIDNYDKNWELIQIFAPDTDTRFVKVLFKKKTK